MWRFLGTICMLSFINLYCKKDNTRDVNNNNYCGDPLSGSYIYNHNLNPGCSAKDFLRSKNYKSLRIELHYMPDLKPEPGTIILLKKFLAERLNKPNGITIEQKEINPSLITHLSLSQISNIENQNRTAYTNGEQLTAYVLIVNGFYSNSNALAISYHNTSICLFGESLKYYSIGSPSDSKSKTWGTILAHEFGHLLGLVNIGSSSVLDHENDSKNGHCINSDCLMYHSYVECNHNSQTDLQQIPLLGKKCLDDLRKNGGK